MITKISNHNVAVASHKDWEKIDKEWKDALKSDSYDREYILSISSRLRSYYTMKSLIHDAISEAALKMSENVNVIEDWNEDHLGEAKKLAEVKELSPEWHELRKLGIGGSAISKVLGMHWKSSKGRIVKTPKKEYNESIVDFAISKMPGYSEPIQDVDDLNYGVLNRGHYWEPAMVAYYSIMEGKRVAVSKSTWVGKSSSYQIINVDGIILGEDGIPEGIIECKTSSRQWTWDLGVPVNYRAQVLWYLNATGLDYAEVVVKFDSGGIDVIRINSDETIDGTSETRKIEDYREEIDDVWERISGIVEHPDSVWSDDDRFIEQLDFLQDWVDEEGIFTEDFIGEVGNRLDEINIVKSTPVAPYVRMSSYYNSYPFAEVNGINYEDESISPIYFPIERKSELKFTSMDDMTDIGNSGVIVAVDEQTIDFVMSFGVPREDVIDASALRRFVDKKPYLSNFSNSEECRKWIQSTLDNQSI